MDFRKLVVSFAVVVSLGACGGVEEGFEELSDMAEFESDTPSSPTRPTLNKRNFIGRWRMTGTLRQSIYERDEVLPSDVNYVIDIYEGQNGLTFRDSPCEFILVVEGSELKFRQGDACDIVNDHGVAIRIRSDIGGIKRESDTHLKVWFEHGYVAQTDPPLSGALLFFGDLIRVE